MLNPAPAWTAELETGKKKRQIQRNRTDAHAGSLAAQVGEGARPIRACCRCCAENQAEAETECCRWEGHVRSREEAVAAKKSAWKKARPLEVYGWTASFLGAGSNRVEDSSGFASSNLSITERTTSKKNLPARGPT